jgi:hypothetical protein
LLKLWTTGRAGPGVSPASPGARATPQEKKNYTIYKKKKFIYIYIYIYIREKKIIHKIKFLIEGKKNIFRG